MKWCARCDASRWVCESHPDRPFSGSRACTCGGAGIPCPVCNPAEEYTEPALHEIKFDGYRIQVHINRGRKKVFTRNGLDWTKRFTTVAGALDLPGEAIIDPPSRNSRFNWGPSLLAATKKHLVCSISFRPSRFRTLMVSVSRRE